MFEYVLSLAVLLSNVANIPQIYKVVTTKRSNDLSQFTFILWSFITFVMFVHSLKLNDIYFEISQFGQFVVNIVMVGLIQKYRNPVYWRVI